MPNRQSRLRTTSSAARACSVRRSTTAVVERAPCARCCTVCCRICILTFEDAAKERRRTCSFRHPAQRLPRSSVKAISHFEGSRSLHRCDQTMIGLRSKAAFANNSLDFMPPKVDLAVPAHPVAVHRTFRRRNTHDLPFLSPPSTSPLVIFRLCCCLSTKVCKPQNNLAVSRYESACARQSLALCNKMLRTSRTSALVRRKRTCVRSADAGSFARDCSLALPACYARDVLHPSIKTHKFEHQSKNACASSAAMHPNPAAVTAWRKTRSLNLPPHS